MAYCTYCGQQNPNQANWCSNCGRNVVATRNAGRPGNQEFFTGTEYEHIPNHLVPAILVTIFCCLFTGIVAIVYAAQVNEKLGRGDIEGARKASGNAKGWCIVSVVTAIPAMLIYILVIGAI